MFASPDGHDDGDSDDGRWLRGWISKTRTRRPQYRNRIAYSQHRSSDSQGSAWPFESRPVAPRASQHSFAQGSTAEDPVAMLASNPRAAHREQAFSAITTSAVANDMQTHDRDTPPRQSMHSWQSTMHPSSLPSPVSLESSLTPPSEASALGSDPPAPAPSPSSSAGFSFPYVGPDGKPVGARPWDHLLLKMAQSLQTLQRIALWPVKTLGPPLRLFGSRLFSTVALLCIAVFRLFQVVFIVATLCNLPTLAWRSLIFWRFRSRLRQEQQQQIQLQQEQQKQRLLHAHLSSLGIQPGGGTDPSNRIVGLLDMPDELKLRIFADMDARAICRTSQTCRKLNKIALDNHLWFTKFRQDWPMSVGSASFASSYAYNQPSIVTRSYHTLYKIRWFTSPRRAIPPTFEERMARYGYFGCVVWEEFCSAVYRVYHLVFLPLKVAGLATWPVHWFCTTRLSSPASPALACLRYCIIDLSVHARSYINFADLHIFFVLNMISLLLLILDELSYGIAGLNCCIVFVASGFQPARWLPRIHQNLRGPMHVLICGWQFLVVPALLLFHLQLVFLPWSYANDVSIHFVVTGEATQVKNTAVFVVLQAWSSRLMLDRLMSFAIAMYPTTTVLVMQILWAPVVCTVEEIAFQYARTCVGEVMGPLLAAQHFIRMFTLCFQCCFGIMVYCMLLSVSLCNHGMRRRRAR
ncbi:hypothetical protein BC831DRAFT_474788 [Entophlyctis helioformis]|nr:hypothetical protein BC831DRAFT_474788 [Entophlyctis helioformis]